ncbi:hypothetical protein [Sphingobacterium griseoflavum]|uniref:HK97 gp10 family phage protein n=1 Tax=Sphingobacterium griseoflavum TaxID=1474952 RepID=A0ABQ3HZ76_9SPHI|nr:hypothetical protein [Sphingobacterium griseoflavum]GHE34888.1 hypothetical protein GCM10017764_17600 [Sphingobacterium griseoflavum]
MARRGAVINTVGEELERYRRDKVKQIRDLVVDSVTKIEYLANRDMIANSGPELNLNFIHVDKKISNGGLKAEVGVMGSNDLAAYVEFGTGLSAADILSNYPQWVRDIAMQFYVNGQGTLEGRPYLYNNFLSVQAEFERELQKIIDK